MGTDLERLVVSLEASITKYEKAMARAAAVGDQRAKQIEKRFSKLETNLKNFGSTAFTGFAKGALGAAASYLTIQTAINQARVALDKFGAIADQSAAAGVDAEFFQGIAYQAGLAGVEIDAVAGALATFAKNSGLAAEGKGRMVSVLQALNPQLLQAIQNAATQEERIRLAADAINEAKNAAEAAAIATTLFGESGTKLVAIFQGGAAAMDEMLIKARDMGLIVERDLIARADELGDKLDTAAQIVELKLNKAFIDLAPLMVDAVGLAGQFAEMLAIVYEQTKAIEQRQFLRPLQNQLAETYNAMQPVRDRIAEIEAQLAGGGPNGMILRLDLTDAKAKLADLEAQANRLLSRIQELQGYKPPSVAATAPSAAPDPNLTGDAGLALLDLNLPSATTLEEVTTGVRSIGTAAQETAAQSWEIPAAFNEVKDSLADAKSLAKDFASSLVGDLANGKSAVDALNSALGNLAQQLLDMALNSAIDGLFGSLFSGIGSTAVGQGVAAGVSQVLQGRASGGPVQAGRPYIVGERQPELFVPRTSGTILPSVPGAGKVVNNVYNYGGDRVETRGNASGGIDVIIAAASAAAEQRVEKNMARGKYRNFGVSPGVRRS